MNKFFVLLMLASLPSAALQDSRLWLPAKYHKLYLDLKEAALAAEALDNCSEVLSGTVDLDQSTPRQPIFRILCRQPDGKSYNEMVDGVTKKTLTTVISEPVELTPEQVEQLRLEQERKLAEQQENTKRELRTKCFQAFEESTRLMLKKKVITPDNAEPQSFGEEDAVFLIDFNARSIEGRPLKYRATCHVSVNGEAEVSIKPRDKKK